MGTSSDPFDAKHNEQGYTIRKLYINPPNKDFVTSFGNSFLDTETCNQAKNIRINIGTFNATDLTTDQMQVESNFTNIWKIDGKNNNGYSYLQWQTFEASNVNDNKTFNITD